MSVLAIDAGATGVTTLVVTDHGTVAAGGHQEFPQHLPEPGWVEHSPEEIWQATRAATRAALDAHDGDPVQAVGITNQRDTILVWDRETLGSPRRAIVGHDRRTADICTRLREAGHEPRVAELTGLRLDPCFSGTKLTWLAENEPNTWALVGDDRYAVGTVDSYLVARMTRGTWHVTDVSNASRTLLFDLERGEWSDELCDLFGVPKAALPDVVPSWGHLATTDPPSFLGLELPVAGIAGDQQSALFGQTCFDVGDSTCTYGTSSFVLTNTGTGVVRSDTGLLSTAAWKSPEGELTYALEGAISATETEALVLEVRDVVETPPDSAALTSLKVGGAASASDLLCQLQADQLGVPVERPKIVETTALGAAFLAGLGTGVWKSSEDLRATWALDRRFEPSDDRAAADAAYARWRDTAKSSKGWAD